MRVWIRLVQGSEKAKEQLDEAHGKSDEIRQGSLDRVEHQGVIYTTVWFWALQRYTEWSDKK